ncbi:Glycine N-acyltransferase-like 3, partial [Mesitornis unicolor]
MLILTCPAQLQRLEGALRRSLPLALPVYGAVLNINRGNPGEFEVVVDRWPDFSAVLARRSGEVAGGNTGWAQWPGMCWGGSCSHGGLINAVTGEYWDWTSWCWGPLGSIVVGLWGAWGHWGQELGLNPEVRVGSLSPAHVDLLNETWPYGGNERSRCFLAEVLGRFPNLCLLDRDEHPISWALTNHFGAGTHGYTLPAHRRGGHMRAVLTLSA